MFSCVYMCLLNATRHCHNAAAADALCFCDHLFMFSGCIR